MKNLRLPRLMLAGISGDCGKTLVALGLAGAWRQRGIPVTPFKKGPDYIDPAWLGIATGKQTRNLDTWMMGSRAVLSSFVRNASCEGINIIEANRGLYDGEDAAGTHSSAELAKLLKTPVVIIIPTVKITRTAAALVLGMQALDRQVEIAGVILNRVATSRQEGVIRSAIESSTGVRVLGAIHRIHGELLASRHLGLVTPEEHHESSKSVDAARGIVAASVDLDRLQSIAENAATLEPQAPLTDPDSGRFAPGLRIGIFRSSAFTFYYPENLEAIERYGAELVTVDPLTDFALPDLDGLYIGGGFPETHAALLSANASFLASVAQGADRGLPIWAECGGLIFLCRSILWQGHRYPMAGVFPADIVLEKKPAGHGYEEVVVDRANPFLPVGTVLRGHEFHYSSLDRPGLLDTVFQVKKGTGIGECRDGLSYNNVIACYLHLHALGSEHWVEGMLRAAGNHARSRISQRGAS